MTSDIMLYTLTLDLLINIKDLAEFKIYTNARFQDCK